ncbi:glycosyltransferase family 4 protein [Vannielia litorea]|uniref:glycosyltransferase family 4 protein n=1 Tax=Vannielia litorea TaxID=1217970 RepID=UPI001C9818EC|nr:glycosyltransferase family 4 protein [Vannielia litorea]MBY6048801.1 glycosyltransferase family 4 protein [Vannielia litorea]MBY6076215.1 glycosyltransferase family 4 protein [Vannielia litorea]
MNGRGGPLLAIGQFPPPVHGFSAVTEAMADALEQQGEVQRVNLAPLSSRAGLKGASRILRCLVAMFALLVARRRGARLAYIPCEGGRGLLFTLALARLARAVGYEVTCHHHSYAYINAPSRLMWWLTRPPLDQMRHVFLSSDMRAAFEARYGPAARASVISNAAFVSPVADVVAVPREGARLRLGLLSNLSAEKGAVTLLDLVEHLHAKGISVEADLAGPVADQDFARVLRAHPAVAAGRARLLGPVYGAAKSSFFEGIDVFVFATSYLNEAEPMVVFEAMAHGVTVVARDRGTIRSQIAGIGHLMPPEADFCAAFHEWLSARRKPTNFDRLAVHADFRDRHTTARNALRLFCRQTMPPTVQAEDRAHG